MRWVLASRWRLLPLRGALQSQRGTAMFPTWEYDSPNVGLLSEPDHRTGTGWNKSTVFWRADP